MRLSWGFVARTRLLCENRCSPQGDENRAIGAAGAQLPYKQTVTGSNPVSPTINYMPRVCVAFLFRAFSSAGEHFLHTEGVIGSIPVTPTIELAAEVLRLGFFIWQDSL